LKNIEIFGIDVIGYFWYNNELENVNVILHKEVEDV